VYHAVLTEGEHIATVEADDPDEAVEATEHGQTAREATDAEAFRYLVDQTNLSYAQLGEQLGTSAAFVGHKVRGDRSVRPMDVMALERFLQLQE